MAGHDALSLRAGAWVVKEGAAATAHIRATKETNTITASEDTA